MDYTDLLKEIIKNQEIINGFVGFVFLSIALYFCFFTVFSLITYFKKRRLAKITRKNLDKRNEIDGTNQDNVND